MSYRFIPQLDDADIRRQQQEGLANTLARVWNSPQYGSKLRACGLKPGDQVRLSQVEVPAPGDEADDKDKTDAEGREADAATEGKTA